ncbi:MAG: twin-arginine translocation signal domain-containing protein, partial [Armatimonadota bacterium]
MDPILSIQDEMNRRTFLKLSGGMGMAALFSLLGTDAFGSMDQKNKRVGGMPSLPHFKPKANRVIYL